MQIKTIGLIFISFIFIGLLHHVNAGCTTTETCTEKEIMVCPESGGGYNKCVEYEPAYPGSSVTVCKREEWVEKKGTCIADWETTCTTNTVCTPAPPPPPVIPPPRVVPRYSPPPVRPVTIPVTPPPIPVTPDPIPTCYEGSPAPECDTDIESDSCTAKSAPVWLRILSLDENGKTISWKPGNSTDPVPVKDGRYRHSVPPAEEGGLDEEGYFKKYRAFSYAYFNGRNVKNEPLHDFNGITIHPNHYDGRRDIQPAPLKDFDKSKNIISNELSLDIVNADTGRNWSNHYCGRGKALYAANKDGSRNINGKFLGRGIQPSSNSESICNVQEDEGALNYCNFSRFGGEYINSCQEKITSELADEDNQPETEYDANEDPHKNRADSMLDSQNICKTDFDGCVSDFLSHPSGEDDNSTTLELLNETLKIAADALPQYDIRYDEYFTLSYAQKIRAAGSEGPEYKITYEFDEEWQKEYYQCQVDLQSYIRIDELPTGYVCDDVYIIKPDGDVLNKTNTADEDFEWSASERSDLVRVSPDGTCRALFKANDGGVMVFPILKKIDSCAITINPTVSCNADNTQATFNWNYTPNDKNPISNIQYVLNKDPLANFTQGVDGDESGLLALEQTQHTVNVEKDALYEISLDGVENGTAECRSQAIAFTCSAPRQDLCESSSIVQDNMDDDFFRVRTIANQPVQEFMYQIFNKQNLDENGEPLPVCIPAIGDGERGDCPTGSMMLIKRQTFDDKSRRSDIRLNYSEIFVPDLNNNNEEVENIIIKTFFRDPALDEGRYSGEDSACNLSNSVNKISFENKIPGVNFYSNLGKLRKVGEWTVDMTPPETSIPVTNNYLYDSFDTEWRVKTDTRLLDANLGCFNLSNTNNYGVTYLGYLDDLDKKYKAFEPLFSNRAVPSSFNFSFRNISTAAVSGNTLVDPFDPINMPFPNCVNQVALDAFRSKVNQPQNLINGGIDVAFKTKFKLEDPENFEIFQHAFKATDLACNTRAVNGGAGLDVPDGWISTDGGTVYYSVDDNSATSPAPPATTQKLDENLYCSYDFVNSGNNRIFYTDANADNSLLNIAKSIVLNDNQGRSFVGAREEAYAPGDDLLLELEGPSATHYTNLLNQVRSKTETIVSETNTLNSISQTGCNPGDERCYIELNGNTTINGDRGVPAPGNYFCNQNALFFVDGDLTINDNIYKSDNVNNCCGFIVNGDINFTPSNPNGSYNSSRYNEYLSYPNVDWNNTYECSTGFYYAEQDININSDVTNIPITSTAVNLSDPLRIKGDLLSQNIVIQSRSNGIGNLSRPAVYLSKDACILNNFPELTHVLLKTRERDFVTEN